ncbi:hypothetical protein [Paenibacillus terrigena]|uniref:hypothetical protein n=1 Tax=Paenibacillus terrigena TaxID=369333 RepID=UPI0028D48E5F|nr:hypothetical protein [Paenibacillus terrigena]
MLVLKKRKRIVWLSALVLIVVVPITIFLQIIIHSNVPELAEGSIEQRYAQQGSYHVKVEEVKRTSGEALFRIYYPHFKETNPILLFLGGMEQMPRQIVMMSS